MLKKSSPLKGGDSMKAKLKNYLVVAAVIAATFGTVIGKPWW